MWTSNNAEERFDRIERLLTYLQQRRIVGKAADVMALRPPRHQSDHALAEPVPERALSVQAFSHRRIAMAKPRRNAIALDVRGVHDHS
jgi:hypothetical protein